MLKKIKIINRLISGFIRIFQIQEYIGNSRRMEQYHGGGEDFNPADETRALCAYLNNNPRDGVVFLYQDNTERKAAPGEKRIYAISSPGTVCAEIHLKKDGCISIIATKDISVIAGGNADVSAQTLNISAAQTILGQGGKPIARVGDTVQVDPATHQGTITSGGINTSV